MRWMPLTAVLILMAGGCGSGRPADPIAPPPDPFRPASMRLHPVFTQIQDWTGDGKPDGLEAMVELLDSYGDPAKGSGTLIFELFEFRTGSADPRGRRLLNPWVGALLNPQDQREHWVAATRAYSFKLAWPQINPDSTYVLTTTFELSTGGRFLDRVVIDPRRGGS